MFWWIFKLYPNQTQDKEFFSEGLKFIDIDSNFILAPITTNLTPHPVHSRSQDVKIEENAHVAMLRWERNAHAAMV